MEDFVGQLTDTESGNFGDCAKTCKIPDEKTGLGLQFSAAFARAAKYKEVSSLSTLSLLSVCTLFVPTKG
jgi:hypothetical protein